MSTSRNARTAVRPRTRHTPAERSGVALLLVVAALGLTVVLTFGLLRSQSTTIQLRHNAQRGAEALDAARAGAAAALQQMQSPDWRGVGDVPARTLREDGTGTLSYRVKYEPVTSASGLSVTEAELPFCIGVVATGEWTPKGSSGAAVRRTVKVPVRLQPRHPGGAQSPGQPASVSDLKPNPANYDTLQTHALVATGQGTSLNFDPGTRWEGPLWLRDQMTLFGDPQWSSSVRDTMLQETGALWPPGANGTPAPHPAPLTGPIRLQASPLSGMSSDMSRLQVSWTSGQVLPTIPAFDFGQFSEYRIFDKGFAYQAEPLSGTLSGITLRPSAANPLGIFYRSGNLAIGSDVVVQGTLVCTGTITVTGQRVALCSDNRRNEAGQPRLPDAERWPRCPAVVCQNLHFDRSARALIEGAVLVQQRLTGGGGAFEWTSATSLTVFGQATATRRGQPYSVLKWSGGSLLSVQSGHRHAVWVTSGNSGRWLPIVSVNLLTSELTVVGEMETASPVNCVIKRNREAAVDIHGPVLATAVDNNYQTRWGLSGSSWDERRSSWNTVNLLNAILGLPRVPFPDYLANPANWTLYGLEYQIYGLTMEPTFHARLQPNVVHQWSAPLFRPYVGTGAEAAYSGYRWRPLAWQEGR